MPLVRVSVIQQEWSHHVPYMLNGRQVRRLCQSGKISHILQTILISRHYSVGTSYHLTNMNERCNLWYRTDIRYMPVYRNAKERSFPLKYRLLRIISKLLEAITNNNFADHLNSNNLMSDKKHSSRLTTDILNIIPHRLSETLYKSFLRAIVLDIVRAFDKVWHRGLL